MSDDQEIKNALRPSFIHPYTHLTKRAYGYRMRLDKSWENYKNCKRNKKITKGTDMIRNMMEVRRNQHLCHQKERYRKEKHKRHVLFKKIQEKFEIEVKDSKLLLEVANKFDKKTKEYKKQKEKQNERRISIINKIINEQKRQEQIDMEKCKVYKIPPKKIIIEEEDEEEFYPEEVLLGEEIEDEWDEVKDDKQDDEQIDKLEEKSETKTNKKEKKDKKENDKKEKKGGKEKKESSKKSKKNEPEVFILPVPPITNPREKIIENEPPDPAVLLRMFKQADYLKKSHDAILNWKPQQCPYDNGFDWKPHIVIFNDFEFGGSYKQKLTITNNGPDTKLLKFHEVVPEIILRTKIIDVENFGIQKIIPGLSFSFNVIFYPEENFENFYGDIIFHTSKTDGTQQMQFDIQTVCEIPQSKVVIKPKHINFKPMNYWEIHKITHTTEVSNLGTRPCFIIIKKMKSSENISEDATNKDEKGLIVDLLEEYYETIFNIFYLGDYFIHLLPNQKKTLKIHQVNAKEIGYYTEKYSIEIMEEKSGKWECVDNQELFLSAEIAGNFLSLDDATIDYNICILNSVYQQLTSVRNTESFPVKIGFQFPSKLKEYFTVYPKTAYLQPNGKQEFSIKFVPRKEIFLNKKHFFPDTNILNFPIKSVTLTKNLESTPPLSLEVYAILTKPDDIIIKPLEDVPVEEPVDGMILVDLQEVSTHEIAKFKIEIQNISMVEQDYAFLNLPEFITIEPDYGFGQLHVGEKQVLTINFHPTIWDIPTEYGGDNSEQNIHVSDEIFVKITCSTIVHMGGIKKNEYDKFISRRSNSKLIKPKKSLISTVLLHKNETFDNFDDDYDFYKDPSENISHGSEKKLTSVASNFNLLESKHSPNENVPNSSEKKTTSFDNKSNLIESKNENVPDEPKEISTKSILIRAILVDNWCEISHQYIDFEDTPIGSFSTMHTYINAFNDSSINECHCGYLKDNRIKNFECHFEIFGGCEEIRIEPTCGDLKQGESRKLTLIARPALDQNIIAERAEIFKIIRLEYLKNLKKSKKKNAETEKSKKSTGKGKDLRTVYKNNPIESEDLYPAEKELWKSLKPYNISTKFVVIVTFPEIPNKRQEVIYIEAKGRVVKPLFLLNTETQLINFGPTIIGTRPKKILDLENISDDFLRPEISIPNPKGPFYCSIHRDTILERQYFLKIPMTFGPLDEKNYQEHMEIICGNTIVQFMVKGEGVNLEFDTNPAFNVCRLKIKPGGKTDFTFTILNKCTAPLELYFKKTFELKGKIEKAPVAIPEVPEAKKGDKPSKKGDKSSKKGDKSPKKGDKSSKKGDKSAEKKFSNELTIDEEYSITNDKFIPSEENTKFKLMVGVDDRVRVEPNSKSTIKIAFDDNIQQSEGLSEIPKGIDKTKKLKENSKNKKSTNDERSENKSKKKEKHIEKDPETYVVKYNVMCNDILLIKEFFIIGQIQ